MIKMIILFWINLLGLSTFLISCAKEPSNSFADHTDTHVSKAPIENVKQDIKQIQDYLVKKPNAPYLTLIVVPKVPVDQAISHFEAKGAQIIYNPSEDFDDRNVNFFVIQVAPELISNQDFFKGVQHVSIDRSHQSLSLDNENEDFISALPFLSKESVNLHLLPQQQMHGRGVRVAVIDTGIDATHPAFQDRVEYWYDATEETHTKLQKLESTNLKLKTGVDLDFSDQLEGDEDIYHAWIDEEKLVAQLSQADRVKGFLDLNLNGVKDRFLVLKKNNQFYFHKTLNKKTLLFDEQYKVYDFNSIELTQENRELSFIQFKKVSYPFLVDQSGERVSLGRANGMHGTHVAGIVAANDQVSKMQGAAPHARLMSLRVCSAISCTDSAIIKGLYKAFYNKKKIWPHVVNISLGSHEGELPSVYHHLFTSLSAKFGAMFFISASNSGPGYRSLNHIGNSGSVVMVGAHVSRETLMNQYNLPRAEWAKDHDLLYFSSLGPSYTSELKPNIIAPGAAISSVLYHDGAWGQANGTSMSSPMAAGTFATLLSLLSQSDRSFYEESNLNKGPYVYAMREALQESARSLNHLHLASQGAGLLQADRALEKIVQKLTKLKNGDQDYFELIIQGKNYDRTKALTSYKTFEFKLNEQLELKRKMNIYAQGFKVRLSLVEEVLANAKIKKYEGDSALKFFSLLKKGDDQAKVLETNFTLANRRNNGFTSYRNFDAMKTGRTYQALYEIIYKDEVIQRVLDVVHRPHLLDQDKSFEVQSKALKFNDFHRYFIQVHESDQFLNLSLNLKEQGRVFIQVYNPLGKEVHFGVASDTPLSQRDFKNQKIPTKGMQGLWEVTICAPSSEWPSPTQYGLKISKFSQGVSKTQISLDKEKRSFVFYDELDEIKSASIIAQPSLRHKVDVRVRPFHRTYFKFKAESAYVEFSFDSTKIWALWSPQLYKKSAESDDAFEALKGQMGVSLGSHKIAFSSLKVGEEYFLALDVLSQYDMREMKLHESTEIFIDQMLGKDEIDSSIKFSIRSLNIKNLKELSLSPLEFSQDFDQQRLNEKTSLVFNMKLGLQTIEVHDKL